MVKQVWRRVALILGFLVVLLALVIAVVIWRPQWLRAIGLGQPLNSPVMDMPMDEAPGATQGNQADLQARWAELMARWQALYAQVQNEQSAARQMSQINAIVAQMQAVLYQMQMDNVGISGSTMNKTMPMDNRGMGMMDMMMDMMGMRAMSGSMEEAGGAMNNAMSVNKGDTTMSDSTGMALSTSSLDTQRMMEMLNQMMLTLNEMQRMVSINPSPSSNAAPAAVAPVNAPADNLAQTSPIGAITVTVTPFSLKNVLTDTVDFYVTLDAPADGSTLDLAKRVTLLVNDQEIPAGSWTVLTGNTRPITGKLRFPIADAAGKSLLSSAKRLSLRFVTLEGDQHSFTWDVPTTTAGEN